MEAVVTLNKNSPGVKYLCAKDKRLAKAISTVGTISYIPHDDEYAFLIHEIIEQMLSIKAGRQIYERLEALCSGRITPQRVSELSDATIRSTGTSNAKVSYIRNITDAVLSGYIYIA
jgi:DNA-3-methyladenine glycosylase II